jgi:hypothetical protein
MASVQTRQGTVARTLTAVCTCSMASARAAPSAFAARCSLGHDE